MEQQRHFTTQVTFFHKVTWSERKNPSVGVVIDQRILWANSIGEFYRRIPSTISIGDLHRQFLSVIAISTTGPGGLFRSWFVQATNLFARLVRMSVLWRGQRSDRQAQSDGNGDFIRAVVNRMWLQFSDSNS